MTRAQGVSRLGISGFKSFSHCFLFSLCLCILGLVGFLHKNLYCKPLFTLSSLSTA